MAPNVHQEKLREEAVVQANRLKSRTPTRDLLFLEGESDESLEAYTRDVEMPEQRRVYTRWELSWRRAHGLIYEETDFAVIKVTHVNR